MTDDLAAGVYELIHTRRLQERLDASPLRPDFRPLTDVQTPDALSRHLATVLTRTLTDTPPEERLTKVNEFIELAAATPDEVVEIEQLVGLAEQGELPVPPPKTPLSDVALLTNAEGEPALAAEISSEMMSADSVDLLCAFVKFTGIRVLDSELRARRDRGIPLRVLTTTYMGATDRKALDILVQEYGAQVKIRYDESRTRLHAKAWLFRRNSGFDTGYVGSSNLSRSAMLDGLEWNVRISGVSTPTLVRKFEATFDTYWNDKDFVLYDPERDGDRLDRALASERGGGSASTSFALSGLEITPRPFQESMLEALDVQREIHGRHRNLLVAATGTGKTVVAAIDYRRLSAAWNRRPTLLFVVHRKEILEQSLRWYREALNDGNFGELYVDGQKPKRWQHVFASVQALKSDVLEGLDPRSFEVIVIDEFHHAAAKSYQTVLDHFKPAELLGLTATPERADGVNVMGMFGGEAAYELRLWKALREGLLTPFQYFGIADNTDLRSLKWSHKGYDLDDLSNVYTGNDARVKLILSALDKNVERPGEMRALGFCVSVDHARFMAKAFTDRGIKAVALSGGSSAEERRRGLEDLRDGNVQCLFAVDLFNEGLDIPDVDTLLMLRPTQSSTVFLQQLGRGLRLVDGKPVLTVLDFVGIQHENFRFDTKFHALTGSSRKRLVSDAEEGFPYLPAGCSIVLDEVTQDQVVKSLQRSLRLSKRDLITDIQVHRLTRLKDFLTEANHDLTAIYPRKYTWTGLVRESGLSKDGADPEGFDPEFEDLLLRKVRTFTHVDDPERIEVYSRLVMAGGPNYSDLSEREKSYARMLTFLLWPDLKGIETYQEALDAVRSVPAVGEEICQILDVTAGQLQHVPRALGDIKLRSLPLLSHAHYRREEILAGMGWAHLGRKARGHSGGVAWEPDSEIDALFVTLHKDEGRFSPSTMYRDYPISRDLFHWESQNSATPETEAGQRYINHRARGSHVLLCTRDANTDDLGSAPYLLLGDVEYVTHRGERPISITWKLRRPMPTDVLQSGSVVGE